VIEASLSIRVFIVLAGLNIAGSMILGKLHKPGRRNNCRTSAYEGEFYINLVKRPQAFEYAGVYI
jgi:hypothetical protein